MFHKGVLRKKWINQSATMNLLAQMPQLFEMVYLNKGNVQLLNLFETENQVFQNLKRFSSQNICNLLIEELWGHTH